MKLAGGFFGAARFTFFIQHGGKSDKYQKQYCYRYDKESNKSTCHFDLLFSRIIGSNIRNTIIAFIVNMAMIRIVSIFINFYLRNQRLNIQQPTAIINPHTSSSGLNLSNVAGMTTDATLNKPNPFVISDSLSSCLSFSFNLKIFTRLE